MSPLAGARQPVDARAADREGRRQVSEQGRRLLGDVLRARRALGHDVPDPGPPDGPLPLEDADDVRRWFAEHRDDVVAAIRLADDVAVELLAHVWRALPADADRRWPLELYDCAAPLAAALPTSRPLAAAFRAGAEALRARGSLRPAAALGMRELAVWRLLDDPEPLADALDALAATYRAQGRLHRVIGCADEVLELRIRAGDPHAVARALTHLGSLMVEVGRLDTALNYLTRADKAFEDGPPSPDRGRAQVLLGRALWLSGDEGAARRRLRRVLPGLADEDARAARELLDLPAGSTPEQGHE
ncbi:tetratricopeptide repeat protein [Actinosynnema sp. NPDC050436]|uniref:tetratricopeptide repeat protein n=1 Tax=Actinosynnema sp. NPDC050436 TaxID=3155659 RepID=UPI0033F30A45